jgi:crotonobetainyl-CoA:carnitine CoA-transferase CaiB-like acyl-CoA transferase
MGPLVGIRVVDVTTAIAGPYCTLILGALGADVIKVERPGGGDDTREWGPPFWDGESPTYLAMNANKRSVVVDLKSDDGRERLLRLVADADVFVHNLRPGRAEKLGLDFESLSAINDRLVHCTVGAFGAIGPKRMQPGYDPLMQAAAGIMSVTGEPSSAPVRVGPSLIDQGTGMWCVIGILTALRRRDAGEGAQRIEASLYETAVNWLPYQIVGYLATGTLPGPQGTAVAFIAPYEAFAASDGSVMIAAANDRLFQALCVALGSRELADDARFATNPKRVEHRAELREALAARIATYATAELLALLERGGIPSAPIQDIAAVVADSQTEALSLLQPLDHPSVDGLRLVALPLAIDGERVMHRCRAPLLDEHGGEDDLR